MSCWLTLGAGLVLLPATATGADPAQETDGNESSTDSSIEGVGLDVEVGANGFIRPGGDLPLRITVTADRLVHGTLNASISQWDERVATVEQQVEVSGGSSAQVWLLVPSPIPDWFEPMDIDVSLREDGDSLAAITVQARLDGAQEVVAVLEGVDPAVEDLPENVPLQVDLGSARLAAAEEELLALGPQALSAFDQLVARPEDLVAMPDNAQEALVPWISAGGHLVLVGSDASALEPVLPSEWLPGDPGQGVRAERGRVRLVEGAWNQKLLPTATSSLPEEGATAEGNELFADQSLQQVLGEDAGVRLPGGGGLGWMLAGYVLVTGPIMFLVLHLVRRRHLAWVGVPVVVALVTAGMFATGASVRRSVKAAHVTVLETGPGGTRATTWSLVGQPRSGEPGVSLPPGWVAQRGQDSWGPSGAAVRVVADGTPEARVDTGTGGYGFIEASGTAPGLGELLSVTAESDQDNLITGTVRNQSGVPLTDVTMFVGRGAFAAIGDLAPDEEQEFTIDDATTFFWGGHAEARAWPHQAWSGMGMEEDFGGGADVEPMPMPMPAPPPRGGGVDPSAGLAEEERAAAAEAERAADQPADNEGDGESADGEGDDVAGVSLVVPSAWTQTMTQNGWGFRPSGEVVAVGWTDELPTPTQPAPGSGETASATTAVVARSAVQPGGHRLTDAASVRTLVRGTENTAPGVPGAGELSFAWAFELPSAVNGRAVDEDRLRFQSEAAERFETVEVWADGRWVPLSGPVAGPGVILEPRGPLDDGTVIGPPVELDRGDGSFEVPRGAVVDGRVFVRVSTAMDPPPDGGPEFTIFEEAAG